MSKRNARGVGNSQAFSISRENRRVFEILAELPVGTTSDFICKAIIHYADYQNNPEWLHAKIGEVAGNEAYISTAESVDNILLHSFDMKKLADEIYKNNIDIPTESESTPKQPLLAKVDNTRNVIKQPAEQQSAQQQQPVQEQQPVEQQPVQQQQPVQEQQPAQQQQPTQQSANNVDFSATSIEELHQQLKKTEEKKPKKTSLTSDYDPLANDTEPITIEDDFLKGIMK